MGTQVIVMGAKGRMGATIASLAQEDNDFCLMGVVEKSGYEDELEYLDCPVVTDLGELLPKFPQAVVIDFTIPEVSLNTAKKCREFNTAAVIGTTGFTPQQLRELHRIAQSTRLLWAPNMSVGINVLLKILPELVRLLGEKYDLEISEIHHKYKKDAPSGTALKLAQVLAQARDLKLDDVGKFCREGIIGERTKDEIGVQTLRGGDVVGDHTVYFLGPGERIEVTHRAHSRETFAQGALRAAEWLAKQSSGKLYSMADVLI
ncbi:4-hydroxy-tetrahydrodipicolinate reductase [Desulfohalobiaceae bacterium Ax17]|uniref:4-hydroxy-tetrahydrodipicolinate reductase n=1 Tax=Desulfovulcanus ferrireducens TaxID=2831190 RepID=UPI00207BCF89|nr:4-hydroxy-tetrahydrodipicolinate reductase [Desulfovulcanus ferrireducens]MBT8763939.1 4-hydroxy-tetrahydrodipicolinate reductase [Desulfovulcanus ferrireducens]